MGSGNESTEYLRPQWVRAWARELGFAERRSRSARWIELPDGSHLNPTGVTRADVARIEAQFGPPTPPVLDVTREIAHEHLTLHEQQQARADLQAALLTVRAQLRRASVGIDVAPGVPVQPVASNILALERAVAELKRAAGVA